MPNLTNIFTPDVVLIDAMNLSKRYHHALQLADNNGVPMGAPYGVLKYIHALQMKYKKAEIIFLWEGKTSFRKTLYPEYKARRQKSSDDPFYLSAKVLKKGLSYIGIKQVYYPGMEADDLAGYYCDLHADDSVLLISNDYDWFQYLRNNTRLQMADKTHDVKSARIKLGFHPVKMPVYKALTGDTSDNIKGLARFPRKLAVHLCNVVQSFSGLKKSESFDTDILSVKTLEKWRGIIRDQWDHVKFIYGLVRYIPSMIDCSNIRAVKTCENFTAFKVLLLRHNMKHLVNIFEGLAYI